MTVSRVMQCIYRHIECFNTQNASAVPMYITAKMKLHTHTHTLKLIHVQTASTPTAADELQPSNQRSRASISLI